MTFPVKPKTKLRGKPFTSATAKAMAKLRHPENMRRGSSGYYRKLAKLPRLLKKKRDRYLKMVARFET